MTSQVSPLGPVIGIAIVYRTASGGSGRAMVMGSRPTFSRI